MVRLKELVAGLDAFLDPEGMDDHGPNGVQVEGRPDVETVVTAVTASRNAIEAAVERKADLLLVHHGIFWKHMWPHRLSGWLGDRVRLLMGSGTSLVQYHLPLDAHPVIGNNVRLLAALGLEPGGRFGDMDLGYWADLKTPEEAAVFSDRVATAIGGPGPKGASGVHHLAAESPTIRRVGVVTGAGQRFFEDAIAAGCDAYITGEASEFVTHVARETGTHYYWAGHHATERLGIQALGDHLVEHYGLDVTFVDDPNPV